MKILLALIVALSLYAGTKQEMLKLYQDEKFKTTCNIGFNNLKRYTKDEEFLSIYAFACLKSDFIDRLSIPTALLKYSQEARSNSAYFSIILMQKKLLYHALIDNYDISGLNLPTTDHVLSKVFDFYTKLGVTSQKPFYLFKDTENKNISYKLYIIKGTKLDKMVIEELDNNKVINKHTYW